MEYPEQKIDADFFEQIYRAYWKKLFGICLYHTGNEHIAEDIVQNIFRSLWEKRKHFIVKINTIEHYLVRAVKLEIMDYYRTGSRRKNICEVYFAHYTESDDSTEQVIFEKELREHIAQLVEQLPNPCKEVYKRSRTQGLNNKEIADQLYISIKTVEYHMTRALRFLQANLQEYKV